MHNVKSARAIPEGLHNSLLSQFIKQKKIELKSHVLTSSDSFIHILTYTCSHFPLANMLRAHVWSEGTQQWQLSSSFALALPFMRPDSGRHGAPSPLMCCYELGGGERKRGPQEFTAGIPGFVESAPNFACHLGHEQAKACSSHCFALNSMQHRYCYTKLVVLLDHCPLSGHGQYLLL